MDDPTNKPLDPMQPTGVPGTTPKLGDEPQDTSAQGSSVPGTTLGEEPPESTPPEETPAPPTVATKTQAPISGGFGGAVSGGSTTEPPTTGAGTKSPAMPGEDEEDPTGGPTGAAGAL